MPSKTAPNKTVATPVDPAEFIAAIDHPRRRAEAETLCALMARVSGLSPKMWGPSIIGFGVYRYKYDSGREGEMARIGFSPRKAQHVIYIVEGFPDHAALLARLGKHTTSVSCLNIRKLADIDLAVLEQLVRASWEEMAKRYPG